MREAEALALSSGKPYIIQKGSLTGRMGTLDLKQFLIEYLKPYPNVEDAIKELTDGQSEAYHLFHAKSVEAHVGLLQIRQRGVTYQVNRKSNIRGTAAYERYIYAVNADNPLWKDDVNVACRTFRRNWDEWFTIRLND